MYVNSCFEENKSQGSAFLQKLKKKKKFKQNNKGAALIKSRQNENNPFA